MWADICASGGHVHRAVLMIRLGYAVAFLGFSLLVPLIQAEDSSANSAPSARVYAVRDPVATAAFQAQLPVVRRLVDKGLQSFAEEADTKEAWGRLIKAEDVVGIKVCSSPGAMSGTRPAVVQALVESLLAAGHAPDKIILWDKRLIDLERAGFGVLAEKLGVQCVAAETTGWNGEHYYEASIVGRLVYGDHEFQRRHEEGVGRRSFVSRLVTDTLTRIIVVTPVLNHNFLGVNGQLANLGLGSVDNTFRFEQDPGMLGEVVPEICAMDVLISKYAFGISDALVCQYRGEERTLLHYAVALNEIRLSRDPVALDSLALADLQAARDANPTQGEKPVRTTLNENAEVINLGVAQTNRIQVIQVGL